MITVTKRDYLSEDGDWQVIFKTKENLDYCRETVCAKHTLDEVKKWAEIQCEAYDLGGAHLEKWGGADTGDTPSTRTI